MDFGSVRRRKAATTYAKRPRASLKTEPTALQRSSGSSGDSEQDETEALPQQPPLAKPRAAPSRDAQPFPRQKATPRAVVPVPTAAAPAVSNASTQPARSHTAHQAPSRSQSASPKKASPSRRGSAARLTPKSRASASPKKQAARPGLEGRPARDLDDIFELHSPRLDDSDSFPLRARSSSSSFEAAAGPSGSSASAGKLDSPLLAGSSLPTLERPASPSLDAPLPAKRTKLSQRMAPRTFKRVATTEIDTLPQPPTGARTLRRTETDPFAGRRLQLDQGEPVDVHSQPSLLTPIPSQGVDGDAASVASRSLPGSPRRARIASEEPQRDAASRQRKFAAISQAPTATAKRTYGHHRSFLADRIEDHLLPGGPEQDIQGGGPSANGHHPITNGSANIENEIESQILGAGQSLLPPSPPSNSASAVTALAFGLQPARESYADLLKKWGDNGEEDIEWDESQDPTLALKSITSLRSAGELRRFNDDLEYLFSGLSPSGSLSIRRSSAVEFVRLVCGNPDTSLVSGILANDTEDAAASALSAEFLRKLRAVEGVVRVFDLFREASAGSAVDDVLDLALVMFLGRVTKKASTAEPILRERRSEMLECLSSMLARASKGGDERRDGLVRLRLTETTGVKPLGRSERSALQELRSTAILSDLFLVGSIHPSLKNMILGTLCSTSSLHKKIGGEVLRQMVQPEGGMEELPTLFHTVWQNYVGEGRKSKQRLADYSKGLEILTHKPFDTWPDLDGIDLCVRFIDRCMEMLYVGIGSSVAFHPEVLDSTVDILRAALQVAPLSSSAAAASEEDVVEKKREREAVDERALQVISGVIKLLLDLTQIDAEWAYAFATSNDLIATLVRTMFLAEASAARSAGEPNRTSPDAAPTSSPDAVDKYAQRISALLNDLVHLSLAAITNLLLKQEGTMRNSLLKLKLSPHCWHRRACAVRCRCGDKDRCLSLLAGLFFRKHRLAATAGDGDAAYLSNSLATAIAQFAVGGETYLEAAQAAADAAFVDVYGDETEGRGFTVLLDAVEKFAADMQKDDAYKGQAAVAAEEGVERIECEGAQREGDDVAAEEAGALIKELARELRTMVTRR